MIDREILETLLSAWNPHWADPAKGKWRGTVTRLKYLNRLKKLIELRHVLILSGVRRAGKSTLMHQLINYLISEKKVDPKNTVYFFLEDILVRQYLPLGWKLLEELYNYYLETHNPQGKVYLFLDEIQGISQFNRWISTKYEFQEPVKFIISGSTRSLVDSEAPTVLTCRNVQGDIYPLNFYEYLQIKGVKFTAGDNGVMVYRANFSRQKELVYYLGSYLKEGGYPEIVLAPDEEA